jgi:hypothetical protein
MLTESRGNFFLVSLFYGRYCTTAAWVYLEREGDAAYLYLVVFRPQPALFLKCCCQTLSPQGMLWFLFQYWNFDVYISVSPTWRILTCFVSILEIWCLYFCQLSLTPLNTCALLFPSWVSACQKYCPYIPFSTGILTAVYSLSLCGW